MQCSEFRCRSGNRNTRFQVRVDCEAGVTRISLQLVIGSNKSPDVGFCREKCKGVRHDADDVASLVVEPDRASDYAFLSSENVFPKGVRQNYCTSPRQILHSKRSAECWRYSQKREEVDCGLNLMNLL